MEYTISQPWYPDGNIIIQVDTTQFRVHKSVLSKVSQAFADVFSIGSEEASKTLHGAAVVELSHDNPSGVEAILTAAYDTL